MKYKEAIEKYELDSKSRKRENVWRRAIIANELRDRGHTTTEIGKLFNRDHSSIIHMAKLYTAWSMYRDFKLFKARFMKEMCSLTLEDKLIMCRTFEDFKRLQEKTQMVK
jgi:hypothetical protein